MSEEKKLEMVHEILNQAKRLIDQVYRPEDKICCHYEDFTDEYVRDIYYELNNMCIKLTDRGVFSWQKDEEKAK